MEVFPSLVLIILDSRLDMKSPAGKDISQDNVSTHSTRVVNASIFSSVKLALLSHQISKKNLPSGHLSWPLG